VQDFVDQQCQHIICDLVWEFRFLYICPGKKDSETQSKRVRGDPGSVDLLTLPLLQLTEVFFCLQVFAAKCEEL